MAAPTQQRRAQRSRSRSERTADSRQLILDATLDCLYELGYARTTTLTIQARAGVSRGRLLHHFPSREGLLVAACSYLSSTHLAELERWAAQVWRDFSGSDVDRLDRAVETAWSTYRQKFFWGSIELWTAARNDECLRAALHPAERRIGTAIQHVLNTMFGPRFSSHPRFPMVCELLLTSMRGVALTYAFNPHPHGDDPHLPMWREISYLLLDENSQD